MACEVWGPGWAPLTLSRVIVRGREGYRRPNQFCYNEAQAQQPAAGSAWYETAFCLLAAPSSLNAIVCCCSSCSLKVMQQIKQMQEAMQVSGCLVPNGFSWTFVCQVGRGGQ